MSDVVVLSPHLDDAVLAAFGPLRRGARVVNVFCGVPGPEQPLPIWDKICGFSSAEEAARARLAEDDLVLRTLGVEAVYVELLDHQNRSLSRRGDEMTAEEVEIWIDGDLRPGDTLLAPLAGGPRPHPDHRLVRDAARRLLRRGWRVELYADAPHAAKPTGWPSWITGAEQPFVDQHRWWTRFPREVPEMISLGSATVERLSDEVVEEKERAARGYVSQFDALDKKMRAKGLVSDVRILRHEPRWSLEAPL